MPAAKTQTSMCFWWSCCEPLLVVRLILGSQQSMQRTVTTLNRLSECAVCAEPLLNAHVWRCNFSRHDTWNIIYINPFNKTLNMNRYRKEKYQNLLEILLKLSLQWNKYTVSIFLKCLYIKIMIMGRVARKVRSVLCTHRRCILRILHGLFRIFSNHLRYTKGASLYSKGYNETLWILISISLIAISLDASWINFVLFYNKMEVKHSTNLYIYIWFT